MTKWSQAWAAALALTVIALGVPATADTAALSDIATALGTGNAAQAEHLADTALATPGLTPAEQSRLLAARGMAREAQTHHDDALVDMTQAIEMHALSPADQAQALYTRGAILDGMGHTNDALGDYSAALMLAPHFAPALNNRANAYRRLKRFAEAKRDYVASLSAENPQPEYPYYGLGQIAEAEGHVPVARGFYAQAVAANPGYALAADRLAALGGAPDNGPDNTNNAAADTGIIHLHPPASLQAADTAPLVLKPPKARDDLTPPPQVMPAAYRRDARSQPGLRPALDGADKHAQAQLSAWRSEAEANQGWERARQRAGGLLDGVAPQIVPADLPGRGRYYRLRVESGAPAKLCAALRDKGVDCIPARD